MFLVSVGFYSTGYYTYLHSNQKRQKVIHTNKFSIRGMDTPIGLPPPHTLSYTQKKKMSFYGFLSIWNEVLFSPLLGHVNIGLLKIRIKNYKVSRSEKARKNV